MKNQMTRGSNYLDYFKKNPFRMIFTLIVITASIAMSCNKDDEGSLPKIVTKDVSEIADVEAICGGTITSNGGSKIVATGLCWTETDKEPTVNDKFMPAGKYTHNGIEESEWDYTAVVEKLTPKTTYKVRAYAANENGVAYGETKSFETKAGKTFHVLTASMIETFTQEELEGPKENLVDGNFNTYWHSAWSDGVAPLPHHIQINFSEPKAIGGVQYWFRSPSGSSGRPNSFDVQTSTDGTTWTTVWTSATNLPVTIMPPTANTLSLDKNYTSKYFRIRILTTPGNTTFTHLSEIKVYHDGLLD
jgi:hypothetical protein